MRSMAMPLEQGTSAAYVGHAHSYLHTFAIYGMLCMCGTRPHLPKSWS